MKFTNLLSDDYAISEIVGGILLIIIAILVFTAIYTYVFPLPFQSPEPNVKLTGYVDNNGLAIIEHVGGKSFSGYRIIIYEMSGQVLDSIGPIEENWEIGETVVLSSTPLCSEEDKIRVIICTMNEDRTEEVIFDGILSGRTLPFNPSSDPPMLISSLLKNTVDEDLICYNYTINPLINAKTYIYNWSMNGIALTDLLYAFDTNSSTQITDYSGNNHTGTIQNATWISDGVVGGAYEFSGNDTINIPYCFSGGFISDITIEGWIKTNQSSGTLLSYNGSSFFELALSNGCVKWVSTANGNTVTLLGNITINNDSWHLIAVSYDSTTGTSIIYVDGEIDISQQTHNPFEELGDGESPNGFLGKGYTYPGSETFIPVFSDDFENDLGWVIANDPLLTDGAWERGIPVNDGRGDPPTDYDGSGSCYLTDNVRGNSDVDGGATWLISPPLNVSSYKEVEVTYAVWYTNNFGTNPNSDIFNISISNNNGSSWILVNTIGPSTPTPERWIAYSFHIEDYVSLTNQVKIRFEASDRNAGSIVEAAVDGIQLFGLPPSGEENYTGLLDELKIYNRMLSGEQIYQNFLCTKDGDTSRSVIVSDETNLGESWRCVVTPNDGIQDDDPVMSNTIVIVNYGGG